MGSDVTVAAAPPVTSDFKYERSRQGRGQKHQLQNVPHAHPGVISSQHFPCLIIKRVAARGWVEGSAPLSHSL